MVEKVVKPPKRLDTDITLQNIMDLGGLFCNVQLYELGEAELIKKKLVNKVISMREDVREHYGLQEEVKPEEFVGRLMGYLHTVAKDNTEQNGRIAKTVQGGTDLGVEYNIAGTQEVLQKKLIEIAKLLTGNEE